MSSRPSSRCPASGREAFARGLDAYFWENWASGRTGLRESWADRGNYFPQERPFRLLDDKVVGGGDGRFRVRARVRPQVLCMAGTHTLDEPIVSIAVERGPVQIVGHDAELSSDG